MANTMINVNYKVNAALQEETIVTATAKLGNKTVKVIPDLKLPKGTSNTTITAKAPFMGSDAKKGDSFTVTWNGKTENGKIVNPNGDNPITININ